MSLNNLSNILLKNLNNHNLQVNLNKNDIKYFKKLISEHPTIFIKISININKIIYDDTIYLQDIPQIILMLSDVYRINIIPQEIAGVDLINIIQYTINSILNSKLLHLQDDLDTIKYLVDASIELLRIKISIVEKEQEDKKDKEDKEDKEEKKYCCFYFF
jgi:hypothetical protein